MSKADYCVFIARCQPYHAAHHKIIKHSLEEEAEKLILVLGSYRAPRSLKNPWTFEERKEMILSSLTDEDQGRVIIVPQRDYTYSDLTWLTSIQNTVSKIAGNGKVKLAGHFKDDSSFYLKLFPQWEFIEHPNYFGANSTDIREALFAGYKTETGELRALMDGILPSAVQGHLRNYITSAEFSVLQKEWVFVQKYKERWATAPFPPVFVTTDAVVVQAGHILLIRRKLNPGKGMLALPGGFLKQNTRIEDSCLEELKEETKIVFPKTELRKSLKEVKVFDHPSRDTRGRTLTHAHFYHLTQLGPLPEVKGADDASEAFWVPINDLTLLEEEFYSDHLHIIQYFINGIGR